MDHHVGLLLINTGTPAAPTVAAVRRYLRQFLHDPRVIDLAGWKRRLLVDLAIVPRRSRRSAAAYRSIWAHGASPLLAHSESLAYQVQRRFDEARPEGRVVVAAAMRYGEPSLKRALDELHGRGVERVVALPLFPHFASASTGSALEALYTLAAARWNTPLIQVVPPFFDHPAYIESLAAGARPLLEQGWDRVVISYHGLPVRHVRRTAEAPGCCERSPSCCDTLTRENRNCYRAQCCATSRALATRLQLTDDRWLTSFQSRLGRDRWLEPATEHELARLAAEGARRVLLIAPSFVADCLETLEELGQRAATRFVELGGEHLALVPALNAGAPWVDAVTRIACEASGWLPAIDSSASMPL